MNYKTAVTYRYIPHAAHVTVRVVKGGLKTEQVRELHGAARRFTELQQRQSSNNNNSNDKASTTTTTKRQSSEEQHWRFIVIIIIDNFSARPYHRHYPSR
jgi:hypothetical protein